MKRLSIFVLFSLTLLLLLPTVAFNDVFGEKLIVSAGDTSNTQFSAIDKVTGLENQIFDIGADGFIGGLTFTTDGKLIASASGESSQGDPGVNLVSILVNQGNPYTILDGFGFSDFFSCEDLANSIQGILCSVKNDSLDLIQIVKIDLNSEQVIIIGDTAITGDSQGNGLTVSSDGTIYFNNQIGLYTIDPLTASETLVGTWTFPSGLNFCKPGTMAYSSNEILYSSFECQDVPYLAEIDPSNANLNSFVQITRNTNLSNLPLNMETDAIIFSSFDFDFLTGSSYGTIQSGFDSISVSGDPQTGLEISSDENSFVLVCDDTSLSTDTDDRVNVTCHDTTIKILSGTVETVFEADDGAMYTASLSIGDFVIFDSETSTITNNGLAPILVSFDGKDFIISPGETISLNTTTDHYLGYNSKSKTDQHHDDDIDKKYNILAQKWTVTTSGEIKSELNDFCLDVKGANQNNGANVIMWPCHGGDNQKWTVTTSGEIKSELNDFCLDVKGANQNNGANVIMWPCHGGDNQKWIISSSNQIYSNLNDKCLSIEDAKKHKKANVEMLTCNIISPDYTSKKGINLVDKFEESKYDVKKITKLFNPVDKNNEGVSDEESHLVEYKIKKSKGESKFKGIKNLLISNQFGDLTIDVKSAKTLLVPSAKSHDSVPTELEDITINHFKCYNSKVSKNTPKFEQRDVNLTDQFGSLTMNVYKEKMFCTPVDKNNEGIINDENYLMCYDLKKIKGEPKFKKINIFTHNQFGPEELQAKNPKRLCVPSTINDPEPTIKFSIPINANSDDAEEGNNSHHDDTMKLKSSDLDLTVGAEFVGLRFNNIPLDQLQTIEHAYIQFTSEDKDKGQSSVTIYGHDTENAPTFTTSDGDISSRLPTTESVMWNILKWKDEKSGTAQQTPNLKSILQEIVDQPNWLNGNSAAFIFTNGMGSDKDAHTFDKSPSKAAVLHIIISDSEPVPDTFAPILSLLGTSPVTINQNDPYTDAGATCLDETDGIIPVVTVGDIIDTSAVGSSQVTYDCQDTAGNDAVQVTRTVNILSSATLTVNVTTSDSSSDTFNVLINGLTPQPVQAITTGIPFGPVSIVSDTVLYTIIQLTPPAGYVTGSSNCVIDGFSHGSQFTASPGDDVICTASFTAGGGGGG